MVGRLCCGGRRVRGEIEEGVFGFLLSGYVSVEIRACSACFFLSFLIDCFIVDSYFYGIVGFLGDLGMEMVSRQIMRRGSTNGLLR